MILLDTCTLLWLASDPPRLSPKAGEPIRSSGEFVEVSAITAWEIAWKQAKGRLELGMTARTWFQLALRKVRWSSLLGSSGNFKPGTQQMQNSRDPFLI